MDSGEIQKTVTLYARTNGMEDVESQLERAAAALVKSCLRKEDGGDHILLVKSERAALDKDIRGCLWFDEGTWPNESAFAGDSDIALILRQILSGKLNALVVDDACRQDLGDESSNEVFRKAVSDNSVRVFDNSGAILFDRKTPQCSNS